MSPDPAILKARLTDPRWQAKPRRKGGKAAMLRRMGLLPEDRLEDHYALVERQHKADTQ